MGSGSNGIWMLLVAALCVVAAAAGGYLVGHAGGADVQQAKAAGERAGRSRADGDRTHYRAEFAKARKAGYAQAYKPAYRTARRQASKKAGQ